MASPPAAARDSVTAVSMRNVHYRVDDSLALDIRHLTGSLAPRLGAQVVNFDDPHSFELRIVSASIALSMPSLERLLNGYVLNYEGSPLSDLRFSTRDTTLVQTGVLHKVIDIPFDMVGAVSATHDGRVRITPVEMTVGSLPGVGLLAALGIELVDLLDLSGAHGAVAVENDLLLNPAQTIPFPAIVGRVTRARIEEGALVLTFGTGRDGGDVLRTNGDSVANFMHYTSGVLRFGRLYMVNADLRIVDNDESDPFDFFLTRYQKQLTAGYSRNLPNGGLTAWFPDYADLESVDGPHSDSP